VIEPDSDVPSHADDDVSLFQCPSEFHRIKVRIRLAGMDDHVTKPVNVDQFARVLGRWASTPHDESKANRVA
jgi:CheY-like chemotaxis protein